MCAGIKMKQGNVEGGWGLLWSEYSGKTALGSSLGGDLNDLKKKKKSQSWEDLLFELRRQPSYTNPSSFLSFSSFSFFYLLAIYLLAF